ncbi:MAG: class I SAM-dependent methyltransferase [Telluria sp.]
MAIDSTSNGWESIAAEFVAARSDVGSDIVRKWAAHLRVGGDVLDIGCGSGVPISSTLKEEGLQVFGIDASPTLVSMFRRRIEGANAACETVQESSFFGRTFDGVVAVGLMFLLSEDDQRKLIGKVGKALNPGGRFLFSAPRQHCMWNDLQTGQPSLSLGKEEYERLLAGAGMQLLDTCVDEGGNHYFDAVLPPA